jgi:lactoylglutathione lyase
MASEVRYSGWFVSDVPATVAFYEKAFGLRLRYMHPSRAYAELEGEGTLLAFIGEGLAGELRRLGDLRYRPDRAAAEAASASGDGAADLQRAASEPEMAAKQKA